MIIFVILVYESWKVNYITKIQQLHVSCDTVTEHFIRAICALYVSSLFYPVNLIQNRNMRYHIDEYIVLST